MKAKKGMGFKAAQKQIAKKQGISQFAFKEAGEEAKRQGLQYGAENPVTKDQIEVALGTGKKPAELFAKRGTIFGEAALQAQSAQLRLELENNARSKMAMTAAEVDAGRLSDIDEVRAQINGPIDGFAKMLAGIDPEESVRFRASMDAAGNTILKSAYDKIISVQNAALRSRLADSVPTTLDFVSRLYETEPDINKQKDLISVYRDTLLKSLLPTADAAFINSTMAKFEEGVAKLRVDAVSKYVTSTDFSADPLTAVSKLDKNDAGKMTSLWSTLNFEDQAKVRSNLRTVAGQRWDVNEKAKKELEDQDSLAAATAMSDYFKTGSAESLRILNQISIRSPKVISPKTVFELPKERSEVLNAELVFWINQRVNQDDILIHLGDWSFGGFENIKAFRDRIICRNVHLILGNHDHHIERNKDNIRSIFSSVNHYVKLDLRRPSQKGKGQIDRFNFVLCHFPIASWDGMNDEVIHLHGHVHLPEHLRVADGKAMDVGVDGNGLEPISLDEVLSIMKDREIKKLALPKDHHEKRI